MLTTKDFWKWQMAYHSIDGRDLLVAAQATRTSANSREVPASSDFRSRPILKIILALTNLTSNRYNVPSGSIWGFIREVRRAEFNSTSYLNNSKLEFKAVFYTLTGNRFPYYLYMQDTLFGILVDDHITVWPQPFVILGVYQPFSKKWTSNHYPPYHAKIWPLFLRITDQIPPLLLMIWVGL